MDGVEVIIATKVEMTRLSKKYGKELGDKKFKLHEVISFPLQEGIEFPHDKKLLGSVVVLEGLGKEKTDFKVETIESLNKLRLTDRETALLLVYLYTIPGFYHLFVYQNIT